MTVVETLYGDIALYSNVSPSKDTPNEDSALVLVDNELLVIAVADGAGGYAGGDTASSIAVDTIASVCQERGIHSLDVVMPIAFEQAHRRIKTETVEAATTLFVLEISRDHVRSYHAGDSAMVIGGGRGRMKHTSLAHSPVGYAVASGVISEKEGMFHMHRHIVSNLLGIDPVTLDINGPYDLAPRDTIVIASDGLFDNLYTAEIAEQTRGLPVGDICAALAELATSRMMSWRKNVPGKADDLTLAVWQPGDTRGAT